MQLKSILNRVERYKPFVYGKVQWVEKAPRPTIEVQIVPRAKSRPICSSCGRKGPGYDRLPPRRFEFVPLWQIAVFFVYAMRRVDCPRCGVTVEQVPWGEGKCTLTTSFRWFLARWAKRLSWQEVADAFWVSWEDVFRSVKHAVSWGLAHRDLSGIEAIGVDEIQWHRGHHYLTLVYQIDEGMKRLLWIAQDRTEQSLRGFFQILSEEIRLAIRFVCSDMCRAYMNVIAEQLSTAVHVLDRFHIMKKMNEAIDEVRREEARRLKQDGYEPVLTNSRWCLLKRPENLTDKQTVKLAELLRYNLKSVRSYLLREDFQRFWEYTSAGWAGKFLDQWCTRTLRTRIEPMKKVVGTLCEHRDLILNWFRARGSISAGAVEGLNNKAKLTTRKAYGFRTYEGIETALYHTLGELPEPKFTHEFC
ncbi:MAG: ISL3 family transposase [Candidatus Sulfotelmatobacter sp.]